MSIDLHIHTYFSDGTFSPEDVVKLAKERKVEVLAISDHNTLEGWEAFEKSAKQEGIIPIKGVEINCKYEGKVFHVLAYGFEETKELMELIKQAYDQMQQMSVDLVAKLAREETSVSLEDYESYEYDRCLGGWKGIHYLLERGVTNKLFEGFKYYKALDCDFANYDFPAVEVLCEAIQQAGGKSVLAHPAEYYKELSRESLWDELEALRKQGIQGIECYYPTHSQMLTETCIAFCKTYGLLVTVGSDEHGAFGAEAKVLEQTIGCMGKGNKEVYLGELLK
ncbi:MAG: PHP domain-containing protein [Cellulosilyticaceae bacterium]